MNKVFYHDDADGKCAAFVLSCWEENCVFFPVVHNKSFPIEEINKEDKVFILDFSVDPEVMLSISLITSDIVWIDHHISAIEKLEGFSDLDGLRSVGTSGCELTWLYCLQGKTGHNVEIDEEDRDQCESYVKLIGDRDVWDFKYGEDANYFYAVFEYEGSPAPEDKETWERLRRRAEVNYQSTMKLGECLVAYTKNVYKDISDRFSYETEFAGKKVLVCNSPIFSSKLFGDRINDYDFVSVYCFDGERFAVSLYSSKMDVLPIAVEMGGGGHLRACGFVCDEIPFRKIVDKS